MLVVVECDFSSSTFFTCRVFFFEFGGLCLVRLLLSCHVFIVVVWAMILVLLLGSLRFDAGIVQVST